MEGVAIVADPLLVFDHIGIGIAQLAAKTAPP
jgi:hypothetical protein